MFKSKSWSGRSRPLFEDDRFEVSSEPCFGHVHRAAAHCRGHVWLRRPARGGGESAPLQKKLRRRGGASARGIGCLGRDAVWAGPTGLRQWPRVRDRRAQGTRRAVPGSRGRLGSRGPGHRGLACGLAGAAGAAGSSGDRTRGRDAERADAEHSAEEPGRCAGALAPQLHSRPPPAARGTRAGKTLFPAEPSRAEIGGGGRGRGRPAGRRPSAVCFFSLPAAAAGDEDGGAKAERPRPPGVTVAPSGFPVPLPPRARAMRAP